MKLEMFLESMEIKKTIEGNKQAQLTFRAENFGGTLYLYQPPNNDFVLGEKFTVTIESTINKQ